MVLRRTELNKACGNREFLGSDTKTVGPSDPFPASMVLSPTSRWPTTLPEATVQAVLGRQVRPVPVRSFNEPGDSRLKSASIVIVTFNNLVFNKLCLESVLANTDYPNYEIVVIDNGSKDGSGEYLHELTRQHDHVRVVFNDRNIGFAPANNQGLAAARGELLVLLNNDTIVPPHWLTRLVRHLEDARVGLVGPVTNRSGNEAQIEVPYQTYGEMIEFACDLGPAHEREVLDMRVATMFCLAMRREVWQHIGPLDERFEVGLFEDDDYSMRARAAGYRVVCAEDVFVHHFGQGSLGKLTGSDQYGALFHKNRQRWEEKWNRPWQPYARRANPAYEDLKQRIRRAVDTATPRGATVLVVSKGDEDLLDLLSTDSRRAWHFPQTAEGVYAGYNPADSRAAITHLDELRARGGEFLVFPSTSFWWLEHYHGLQRHLERRYRQVFCQGETCLIYALSEGGVADV